MPDDDQPYIGLHQPAAWQPRSSDAAKTSRPDRQAPRDDSPGAHLTIGATSYDFDLTRKLAAEALGTCILVATVVGSGIMADRLTDDVALTLLGNTLPTGAILVVLIAILGPISGAHFNPAVTLVFALRRELSAGSALAYALVQIVGGIAGTFVAHLMFDLPLLAIGATVRSGPGQWIAEAVATFGLIVTILGGLRFRGDAIAWLVGLYITAAYWFTASTSFANPAVTIARAFTETFAGIRPPDVAGFVASEVVGGVVALMLAAWLFGRSDGAPLPMRGGSTVC